MNVKLSLEHHLRNVKTLLYYSSFILKQLKFANFINFQKMQKLVSELMVLSEFNIEPIKIQY